MKAISRNQQIFIDEYILHGNATLAYSKAYGQIKNPGEMGYKLLNSVKVGGLIKQKKEEIAQKYNITKEFLVKELLDLIASCKNEPTGVDRGNWNKAIQTLAKVTGHDIQKIEVQDKTTKITVITNKYDELVEQQITDVDFEDFQEKEQILDTKPKFLNFKINEQSEQESRDRMDEGTLGENS